MILRVVPRILLLFLFSVPFTKAQQIPAEPILWHCWLGAQDDYNIHCVRETDPLTDSSTEIASAPYDDEKMRREFFAPGKPKNVARLVRDSRDGYQSILWSIPLFYLPTDQESVKMLAETIMCGSDNDCTVSLDTSPLRAARR